MIAPEIPLGQVAVQAMLLVQPGLGTCDFRADAGGSTAGGELDFKFSG